jgi:class 3 adenylate cyclase/predicted ATPase
VDIASWLAGLGLERYKQAFHDNDIDGELLRNLTGDDLKDMGVGSVGHRRKLLEAIAELQNSGGVPRSYALPLAVPTRQQDAERRQLTIMFIDLVGSTALSAQLDPEDMSKVICAYQNAVAGEIARFEGYVAKFMGDGVLAYFGWPRAHEDEAERAVRAGLAIAATLAKLTGGGEPMNCRVGIATGLVVVGDLVGQGAAQEQAVVGDTPNLAARLQRAAEPGMVVIAEATRHLVGDLFVLQELAAQRLWGIAEPIPAFAVVTERAVESRFAARQSGGVTPIVARDEELALLIERWRQAKSGEGQMVVLSGEAGIGKSRITEALIDAVSGEPHFLLRYQCSPYHVDSPLYPAIQQIAYAAGFAQNDSLDRRLDRLEALLARANDDISEAAPLAAALMGLNGAPRYGALTLPPPQRRNRTLAMLIDQVTGLARSKPVLLVVEDAHWIDPTTLELIELALDYLQGARICVLITARPNFVASFGGHPVVTRLELNRLGRAAILAIIACITRGKSLPQSLHDEIAAKTDGVPLFAEEMTKAVLESGLLREDVDAYHLEGSVSALAVPATLHDSLMARLDRFQLAKEIAQIASVIGRSFDYRTIAALAARPESELADAIGQLVEAELVFRRGTAADATYLFKHALVRDVAYGSLLKAKRLTLHARLLHVLEDRADAAAEVKAQHAEAAGLAERALDYWEEAGTLALAKPAYKESIANLEHGLRLCRAMGEERRWSRREHRICLKLGQALIADQGFSAVVTLRAFERALALADEIGDVSLQLPALSGKWVCHYTAGNASREDAQRFTMLAAAQPETELRLVGNIMLGAVRFQEGRFRESLTLTRKALDNYDPNAHQNLCYRFATDPRASAMNYTAWDLWHLGFPDQAARMVEENLRWVRELNHPYTTGYAFCYSMITNIWLRRPSWVEDAARQALRHCEEMSLPLWHARGQIHLGWALFEQHIVQGLKEIEAGLLKADQVGAEMFGPFHLGLAANAYSLAGRHQEASASIKKAFEMLTRRCDLAFAAELHRIRAAMLLRTDATQRRVAEADLSRALEIARQQEALSLQLRAARDLAQMLAEQGERQQAADLLIPVYNKFTEGFDTSDLKEARTLLDEMRA